MNKRWLYNKKTILAAAITTALISGCGGGSSSSNDPSPSTGITITALDGYLSKASVSIDVDGNGTCETLVGITDDSGQFKVSDEYKDKAVCVAAVAGTTVDMTRGIVGEDYTLRAPIGSEVVNPLTNLVIETLEQDTSLTLELAQQLVVDTIVNNGLVVDDTDAFGDYLALSDTTKSKQLEVIGEVLVDNHSKPNITPEAKLTIVQQVTSEVNDKTADELEDFNPIIGDIDDNGNVPPITPNYRPVSVGAENLKATTEVSDGTSRVDLVSTYGMRFLDSDPGATFTYKVSVDSEYQNGVTISDSGVLSGIKEDKAGVYTFYIFAVDNHGAQSSPVTYTRTLTSANVAPTIDPNVKATLEQTIQALDFTKGVEFPAQTINLDGLFIDEDVDSLTIHTHLDGFGLSSSIVDGQVVIEGTPTVAGDVNIAIWAEDGVNQDQASVTIFFTVKDSDVVVTHPLEGKTLYYIDNQYISEHPKLSCNSVEFKNNIVYFSPEQAEDVYTCAEATEEVGTYEVDSDVLRTTVTDNNQTVTDEFTILLNKNEVYNEGFLVKAISLTEQVNGAASQWVTHFNPIKKDAENVLNMETSGQDYRYSIWHGDKYIDGKLIGTLNGQSQLNGEAIASASFNPLLSCADINTIYGMFYLSNENRSTALSSLCEEDSSGVPAIKFNSLSGTGEDNLANDKYYTITSDLKPQYQDVMAPLTLRIKYRETIACTALDDSWNEATDLPTSLTLVTDFNDAMSTCRADSDTYTNLESAVINMVNEGASTSFKLKSGEETYVFHEQIDNVGTAYLKVGDVTEFTANWTFTDGDIILSNLKDVENGNVSIPGTERLALTQFNYTEKSYAIKGIFQSSDFDQLGLGNSNTHGSVHSDIYVFESGQ